MLLQELEQTAAIVRIRYPPAKPERRARHFRHTSRTVHPPAAGGCGIYARTIYAVNSDYPGPC